MARKTDNEIAQAPLLVKIAAPSTRQLMALQQAVVHAWEWVLGDPGGTESIDELLNGLRGDLEQFSSMSTGGDPD